MRQSPKRTEKVKNKFIVACMGEVVEVLERHTPLEYVFRLGNLTKHRIHITSALYSRISNLHMVFPSYYKEESKTHSHAS